MGLLLLRTMLGVTLVVYGVTFVGVGSNFAVRNLALGSLAILSGTLIIVGFITAISSVVICFCGIVVAVSQFYAGRFVSPESAILPIFVAIVAASLTLLGPGAISVDSRLFGRREIVIPKRPG